eukprot:gene10070-12345_t
MNNNNHILNNQIIYQHLLGLIDDHIDRIFLSLTCKQLYKYFIDFYTKSSNSIESIFEFPQLYDPFKGLFIWKPLHLISIISPLSTPQYITNHNNNNNNKNNNSVKLLEPITSYDFPYRVPQDAIDSESCIPKGVGHLFIGSPCRSFHSKYIPNSVHSIEFSSDINEYNPRLEFDQLPETITRLILPNYTYFVGKFPTIPSTVTSLSIQTDEIPMGLISKSVTHLKIGGLSKTPLPGSIPDSVIFLDIVCRLSNEPILRPGSIPSSVRYLSIATDGMILPNLIPDSCTHLKIGQGIIGEESIPNSVTSFFVGRYTKIQGNLPKSITHLYFVNPFKSKTEASIISSTSVTHLYFSFPLDSGKGSQPFKLEWIPNTVTHLCLGSQMNKNPFILEKGSIPPNVTHLWMNQHLLKLPHDKEQQSFIPDTVSYCDKSFGLSFNQIYRLEFNRQSKFNDNLNIWSDKIRKYPIKSYVWNLLESPNSIEIPNNITQLEIISSTVPPTLDNIELQNIPTSVYRLKINQLSLMGSIKNILNGKSIKELVLGEFEFKSKLTKFTKVGPAKKELEMNGIENIARKYRENLVNEEFDIKDIPQSIETISLNKKSFNDDQDEVYNVIPTIIYLLFNLPKTVKQISLYQRGGFISLPTTFWELIQLENTLKRYIAFYINPRSTSFNTSDFNGIKDN